MYLHRRSTIFSAITAVSVLLCFWIFWQGQYDVVFQLLDPHITLDDPESYQYALQRRPAEAFRTEYPYSRVMVIPTVKDRDLSWIEPEMADLLVPFGNYTIALYVVNDPNANFTVPVNKGHEAMAYLTYMIDAYDKFPDVSVFHHGRRIEWHNNNLLDASTPEMLRRLNLDKVMRDGYVNLRCQWNPGCPDQIHTDVEYADESKLEELYFLAAWESLFPDEGVPLVVAQPCCSQFAVSRERLQSVPRERYIHMRDWLINTDLPDHLSGRIFEYVWQYLLNEGTAVFCPDPRVCYCELYGVCFSEDEGYDEYFNMQQEEKCYEKDLEEWQRKENKWQMWYKISQKKQPGREPVRPEEGLDQKLMNLTKTLTDDMFFRQQAAFDVGRDSSTRASALHRGWTPMEKSPRDGPECERETG